MSYEERKKLRNYINQNKVFINKKKEPAFLLNEINRKDKRFKEFVGEMETILS